MRLKACAAMLSVVLAATCSVAAERSTKNSGLPSPEQQRASHEAFVQSLRTTLNKCKADFVAYQMASYLWSRGREADAKWAELGSSRTTPAPPPPEARHVACVEEAKAALAEPGKQFIRSFQAPIQRGIAADLVAQWLTVMDLVGTPQMTTESTKFDSLVNRLLVDL